MSRATDLLPTASTLIDKQARMGEEIGPAVRRSVHAAEQDAGVVPAEAHRIR